MTKKKWANYLKPWVKGYGDDNRINALALADRILAALDQERAGEVVLAEGKVDWEDVSGPRDNCAHYEYTINGKSIDMNIVDGKRGTLIFREQEGK